MKVEEISLTSIQGITDQELYNLRFRFIQLWEKSISRKNGKEVADFLGHYRILINEMNKRGIQRQNIFDIDREVMKTSLYNFTPKTLEDLVYIPDFVSIAGSFVKSPKEANDIDLIIRREAWDEGLTLKVGRALTALGIERLHFVYSPTGPHSSYIPVYDLILRPKEKLQRIEVKEGPLEKIDDVRDGEPMDKAALILGRPFTPLKSKGGYGEYEFADIDALWSEWAQGYIPDPGLAVETKFDGFRVQIHKKGAEVKILSEDAKRDLVDQLPDLAKEVSAIKADCILDGELTVYVGGKKVERKDMPSYVSAKEPAGEFSAKIDVFDCLWFEDRPLNDLPWSERQGFLDKIFASIDELNLRKVKPTVAKTEEQFRKAIQSHAQEAHSEGAMCKVINSKYPLDGSTPEWAKFKNFKSLTVKVVGREKKEGGGWIYTCEIADGIPIGRTYATNLEAETDDIIEVAAAEVKYNEEKGTFTWDNPIPREVKAKGTALTTKEQAIALSKLKRMRKAEGREFGNIDYALGDKGEGISQIHIMGIPEEGVKKLKEEAARVMVARADLRKLEQALKSILGSEGAHLDIRMRRGKDNFWEGGEIMLGNLDGLSKIYSYKDGQKLRFAWKQSKVSEPKTGVVQGPLGWMEIGSRSPQIFEPGESGATANLWAAMIRIDKFSWELYLADNHAKKIHITGSKHFAGNWLFSYVPVTEAGKKGERVWMMSKLEDDDHEKKEKELTESQRRECDAETEKIRENRKTAVYPHKFKPAKWTHPNGHPRCILCGQEERTEGICKKPLDKGFEKGIEVFISKADEHIVGGIVYEPDIVDAQGDWASEEDIREAAYYFMENRQALDVRHNGKVNPSIKIIESYIVPQDFQISGKVVKKGAWYLTVRILDEEVWNEVKQGKLTGFSLFGTAAAV